VTIVVAAKFEENAQDLHITGELERILPGLYFSGGKVFPMSMGRKSDVIVARTRQDLARELGRLPAGFLLVDRADMLENRQDDQDSLDALLDIVESRPQMVDDKDVQYARRYGGWLVPIFIGYQAIERMRKRSGLRHDGAIGHVFAESVYSIGEFKSVRGLIAKGGDLLSSTFWKHQYNPSTETYFVSATR
jgi:CRISPR type I-F-associated protein Csy2